MKKLFEINDIDALSGDDKVGLVATRTPDGLPHISMLTSLQPKTEATMMLGEFCKGTSKDYWQQDPRAGFLFLTMDKHIWRGKMTWTRLEKQGADYEMFNNKPIFRYNSYFGVNTVHHFDLVETSEREPLPMARIIPAAMATMAARAGRGLLERDKVMNPWTRKLFSRLDSLKFIAWLDQEDGYPRLAPLIQCQAADSRTLTFSNLAYGEDLARIQAGSVVAIMGLTLALENVVVRGRYQGVSRQRGIPMGEMDIEWIYNSMPPTHGQIYPPVNLEPVVRF